MELREKKVFHVELPYPPRELNPNSRENRHKVARIKAKYRKDCELLSREALGRKKLAKDRLVNVLIDFWLPDARKRDMDNVIAAFKSGQDGVVDAIGIDDSFWVPDYMAGVECRDLAGVRLTVFETPYVTPEQIEIIKAELREGLGIYDISGKHKIPSEMIRLYIHTVRRQGKLSEILFGDKPMGAGK